MRHIGLFIVCICIFVLQNTAQTGCVTETYITQLNIDDLSLGIRTQQQESFVTRRLFNREPRSSPPGIQGTEPSVIRIPVVVHVVYNKAEERISAEQVRTQIEVLNRQFRKHNSGILRLPSPFQILAADCFIEFFLATVGPRGGPTTGIIWKKSAVTSFGTDDQIKFSQHGGDDAWDADQYLNIWVGKLSAGRAGYSSPLGADKQKDGIVINYTAFGTIGTASAPYHLGKLAVHETGHWLGLKHIWGDSYCGDDLVGDTPAQPGATQGCPSGIKASCDNSLAGSMYMNYMDLTYDACTELFTTGQRDRMRAVFAEGGPRHALLSSPALNFTAPIALDIPVAIDSLQSTMIFPNPVANLVTIKTVDHIGEPLSIYDSHGRQVHNARITSNTMQFNISRLKTGIYFVCVGQNGKPLRLWKAN